MEHITAAAIDEFARVYAQAVTVYLVKREHQQVFVNYSLHDREFYWEVDEDGVAGDDVDHLIMFDWQRHTGAIELPLYPHQAGYSREGLCAAIQAAVLANGFAARTAASIRARVHAAFESATCDPSLH